MRRLLQLMFLLLLASPAWATCSNTTLGGSIVCIDEEHVFSATSVSSVTTSNFATNPAVGNTIWVFETREAAASGPTCNTSTPTDTLGNTASLAISVPASGTLPGPACIYVFPVTTGGSSDAVTCKMSTAITQFDCDTFLLSGLTSSPIDKSCSGQTTNTNPTCSASITPTVNGELILAGCAFTNGTLGAGTNFAFLSAAGDYSEYYVQPTAAAITPAYTDSSSGGYLVLAVSLTPATTSNAAFQIGGFLVGP